MMATMADAALRARSSRGTVTALPCTMSRRALRPRAVPIQPQLTSTSPPMIVVATAVADRPWSRKRWKDTSAQMPAITMSVRTQARPVRSGWRARSSSAPKDHSHDSDNGEHRNPEGQNDPEVGGGNAMTIAHCPFDLQPTKPRKDAENAAKSNEAEG